MNEVQHDTTGFTPNKLQLGHKNIGFWEDVVQNPFKTDLRMKKKPEITENGIKNAQDKRANKYNSTHKMTILKENSLILIDSHSPHNLVKDMAKQPNYYIYVGPLKIGKATYILENEKRKPLGP